MHTHVSHLWNKSDEISRGQSDNKSRKGTPSRAPNKLL